MMMEAKKSKILWDCLKSKILAIKKAKKISQDKKDREREVLVGICFNKGVVQMLIIDLGINI